MKRNIFSMFLGVLSGFFIIFLMEIVSHIIYPQPAGLDIKDMDAIRAFTSTAPAIVFVLLVLSYSLGALVGGLVTAAIAAQNKISKAITAGGILMGVGVYNLFLIPHPVWTIIISIFLFIPCSYLGGYLGVRISAKRKRNEAQ